jgi:hypothetical protein
MRVRGLQSSLTDYNKTQTRNQLQLAYLEAIAGRIGELINIVRNSFGKYDFGWNGQAGDTWTLCGMTTNGAQMGDFIASFETKSYDRPYFWTPGAIWAQTGVALGRIAVHLQGETTSENDLEHNFFACSHAQVAEAAGPGRAQ